MHFKKKFNGHLQPRNVADQAQFVTKQVIGSAPEERRCLTDKRIVEENWLQVKRNSLNKNNFAVWNEGNRT